MAVIDIFIYFTALLFLTGGFYFFKKATNGYTNSPTNRHNQLDASGMEQALKHSEEKTKLIINSALDAIICIDSGSIITIWNPQAEKIFGWKAGDVLGQSLTEIIVPPQYREHHKRGMQRYLQTGEGPVIKQIIEITALNHSGIEFPIELTIIPIKQNGGEFFCAFIRDITERKMAERKLNELNASLQKKAAGLAAANAELEQFVYIASHDLQEPLRTTSSFIELLDQQYAEKIDDKGTQYLSFIKQSSLRMQTLINDLLDFSRLGRKKELQLIDCNILLRDVLADLNTKIQEEQAEITITTLPVINGYPTELKLLFQNLIINAIKFRKNNYAPSIKITAEQTNDHWTFVVQDNGIGIEDQHREKIFIIFRRLHTREKYEGSGIGLAHCKKIVELHGGKIWVESEVGEGSRFYFTIPCKFFT
jgi:PAS domain S-box-containing protein